MSKIDELIQEYCPGGVHYLQLGEVASYIRGITYSKNDESADGSVKVLRANNIDLRTNTLNFDDAKTVNSTVRVRTNQRLFADDILISAASGSKAHVGKVAYIHDDLDYCFGGFMAVLRTTEQLDSRFLFHLLVGSTFSRYLEGTLASTTINNLSASIMNAFKVPVPPLEVQKEIVNILDKFTQLEAELSAELEARRKQYEYYRSQLFAFNEPREDVEWLKLGDVARVTIGEFVHKNKQNSNGLYPVYNGGRSETGFFDEYNNLGEKIVISARGAYAGFVNRVMKPYWAGNSSYSISVTDKSKVNWHYVYYYLKSSENKFTEQQQKGGIPAVSKKQVEVFKIPVPTIDEQNRIVAILDKFDKLNTSISEGLPAEIEARRKQYEYYRTKLLTFQEQPA